MAQTLVNGTTKTNTINAKELYSGEAGACEAAREPASKGSDTTQSKNTAESLSRAFMEVFDSAGNGGAL
jgi:hypothetical protein